MMLKSTLFKRLSIIVAAMPLFFTSAFTQTRSGDWCQTEEYRENWLDQLSPSQKDRVMKKARQYVKKASKWGDSPSNASERGTLHTIPVVFHIMHDNGPENISAAQVKDGIRVLNEDFRRTNSDTNDTRALFEPYAVDSEFEFKLAQKDPNGNCTNGIVRIQTNGTYDANNDIKHDNTGGDDAWPENQYFNIWVVNSIDAGAGGTVLGYAQLPQFQGVNGEYGVVIRYDAVGTIEASFTDGRSLTHEVGHCLGLLHTFQSGCAGDCDQSGDYMCDTPPVSGQTFGCDQSQNTCSNDTQGPSPFSGDVVDQIENYMSYDNCQNMFSSDQKSLMKYTINNEPKLTNLVSASNLSNTGVSGNPILCKARFDANRKVICNGQSVDFTDQSYNGVTTWSWNFPGGTPSSSSQQDPTVTYNSTGTYDVELVAGNGNDTVHILREDYITVMDDPGEPTPWVDIFDWSPSMEANPRYFLNNIDKDSITWKRTEATGYNNSKACMMINNFDNLPGNEDEVATNSMDASNMSNVAVVFDVAYAQRNSGNNGTLELYASNDCGMSWSQRGSWSGSALATVSPTTNRFVPNSNDQWQRLTVDNSLISIYQVSNLRFKFKFIGDGGNNIYIDNINVLEDPNTVGLEEAQSKGPSLKVYPNPVQGNSTLELTLAQEKDVDIELINILGEKVQTIDNGVRMNRGRNKRSLDLSDVGSGAYFLRVRVGEEVITHKIFKE